MSGATILIIEAIRSQRLLAFVYHGSLRIVEPHTYGLDKWRREMLCAYQVQGVSRSGDAPGWRTFLVEEIGAARIEARRFDAPREQYRRDDRAFAEILAQL